MTGICLTVEDMFDAVLAGDSWPDGYFRDEGGRERAAGALAHIISASPNLRDLDRGRLQMLFENRTVCGMAMKEWKLTEPYIKYYHGMGGVFLKDALGIAGH